MTIVEVGPYDILCGRNSTSFNNIGNRRFRVTIALNLKRYMKAKTRQDKAEVIVSVLKLLRNDIGARFLKRKGDRLIELSDNHAREKVGHALRDLSVQQPIPMSSIKVKQSSSPRHEKRDEKGGLDMVDNLESLLELLGAGTLRKLEDDLSLEPLPVIQVPAFYAQKA